MRNFPILTPDSIFDAVILANGEYPAHRIPLSLLESSAYTVCCDGAADRYIRDGFVPAAIVGDGDSISDEVMSRYASIIHLSSDQETNDQTKAVEFCLSAGKENILIVGATGKREDHTLGNISLLIDYMDWAQVCMATGCGFFVAASGDASFDCIPGMEISIINFGSTCMKGEGLAYPLRGFTNWWQGTLNRTTGNRFTIAADGRYLVFRTYGG